MATSKTATVSMGSTRPPIGYSFKPVSTGIHVLTQLIDRLTLHRFGETREPYMLVQDVTDWHRKELAETNGRSGDIAHHSGLGRRFAYTRKRREGGQAMNNDTAKRPDPSEARPAASERQHRMTTDDDTVTATASCPICRYPLAVLQGRSRPVWRCRCFAGRHEWEGGGMGSKRSRPGRPDPGPTLGDAIQ